MHHNSLTEHFNAQLNIQDIMNNTDWDILTKQKISILKL